jgi:ornithine cyclodeaminase
MSITILTEKELRECITLDQETISAIEDGFSMLSQDKVSVPPIMRIDVPKHNGEVDVKTAYVEGLERFAIKIASGFFENRRLGLPTGSGMMVLINAKTGFPETVLLDNGYLTDVRTGAAGAVAAKHLARKKIQTVGVIGSGTQARYQVRGLSLVREFESLLVFGIVPEEVSAYVSEMESFLGVEIVQAEDLESVVCNSDVVITTTPAREPYLRAEWLHPGLHITAMGSDSEEKQELHAAVLGEADLIVCDRRSQCERLGELHHALVEGVLQPDDDIAELGDLTSGKRAGRTSDEQVTVCDLTGVGVQDTMIAVQAQRKALEKQMGLQI